MNYPRHSRPILWDRQRMNTALTEADHIHKSVREIEPIVRPDQLCPEQEKSFRVVQVHGDFTSRKRPGGQVGETRRKSSAGGIWFLIFVEARSRRIIEGEMRRNNGSHEEQTKKLHGGSGKRCRRKRCYENGTREIWSLLYLL